MRGLKVHYFLFLAVFMLTAKPFIGFDVIKQIANGKNHSGVYVKAFTKRKQEYVEDSDFDISTIHKQLANPLLVLTVLFSAFLTTLFSYIVKKARQVTAGFLSDIYLRLSHPPHRYLLSGKLII